MTRRAAPAVAVAQACLGYLLGGLGGCLVLPSRDLAVQRGSALGTAASGVAVLGAPIMLDWIASGVGLRTAYLAALPVLLTVVATQRYGAGRR